MLELNNLSHVYANGTRALDRRVAARQVKRVWQKLQVGGFNVHASGGDRKKQSRAPFQKP